MALMGPSDQSLGYRLPRTHHLRKTLVLVSKEKVLDVKPSNHLEMNRGIFTCAPGLEINPLWFLNNIHVLKNVISCGENVGNTAYDSPLPISPININNWLNAGTLKKLYMCVKCKMIPVFT